MSTLAVLSQHLTLVERKAYLDELTRRIRRAASLREMKALIRGSRWPHAGRRKFPRHHFN